MNGSRQICSTKAIEVPQRAFELQDIRIDFQFDTAAFEFKALPFKIPYPVPFKLLGDETKVDAHLVQYSSHYPVC